uniref:Uncharacterized protein n=1 Tax=Anguilla anguilla TaxID=7936 RepID=A0A0E9UD80_ANGAN
MKNRLAFLRRKK